VNSGLAALLGAIIGGGLTAGSNLGLEFLRHRRTLTADSKNDARELRRGARLIRSELAHSAATIERAAKVGTWEPADLKELKYNRWVTYQQPLADHLPDQDWASVDSAYELLYLITRANVGNAPVEGAQYVLDRLVLALRALDPFASTD
jgi:hypothetical protein